MLLTTGELREVQLGVLAGLDAWCRRHGVTYYLAYGTLLGAIRDGGFIPWDDDVDVMVPREDYERLLATFADDPPPHLYVASPRSTPDWPLPYAKVCDDRTALWEPLEEPVPMGVNVDVFPLDPVPAVPAVRAVQALALRVLRWAVELRYIQAERGRGWHRPFAIDHVKPLLGRLPVRVLVAADTWVARHAGRASDRVGVRVGSYDWSVDAAALGEPGEVDFEGVRCRVPADPLAVLDALYGDWRRLPPEEQRVSEHAFTAEWRRGA